MGHVGNLRPNIFIDLKERTERYETELEWLLDLLLKCDSRNKIIVYVRSINMCYQLYLWLVTSLMEKCFVGEEAGPSNRRVDMFHANTDKISKERIIDQFVKENGIIEVLISTVAFEMGVNIPNIDIVVHRGLPSSCLSYWQEVGDVLTMAEGAMQSVMHLKEASQAVKMTLLRNLLF